MSNWKEEAITRYAELEALKKAVQEAMRNDGDLETAKLAREIADADVRAFEQGYTDKIGELEEKIENVRILLQQDWDIKDKTYKCDAGSATIRTTKSLCVLDKSRLIATLIKLDKLPASIRSWDLTVLRKLKDVDLIPDDQVDYEERQNMIIRGSSK